MKYTEIVHYAKQKIESKHWRSGERIPSIRESAEKFHCSKATVIRAYHELETTHQIYSVPQSGYFVVTDKQQPTAANRWIDFASMMPEAAIIPYQEMRHCINQALDHYQEESFMYNSRQGLPDLRAALAKVWQNQQVFISPQNLLITAGAQQTLDILVRMPFPNGKSNILVEQPSYAGIINSVNLSGATALGIPRTVQGIDFEQLENLFKNGNIKFFYTMPRFHNPLGASYTRKEKMDLLALARQYDVYLVEDDYLAEFDFDSKADPLAALDSANHVIYIKSYTKACLPGLRIGAVLLPAALKTTFMQYKKCVDPYISTVLQGALALFITNGMYDRHVKKLKKFYQPRISLLQHTCQKFFAKADWETTPHCPFLFLKLPEGYNLSLLIAALERKNILVQGGGLWYLPHVSQQNGLRLCIYQTNEQQIEQGIADIAAEIELWLHRPARKAYNFSKLYT